MFRPMLAALPALLLVAAPALRAADDDPKEIIARAIKAHGGEDVLVKMKAGQSTNKGKINIPGVGEVEFTQQVSYMMPDKFKDEMELTVMNQKVTILTLVVGDKVTIEANGQAVDGGDKVKEALKEAQYLMKVARFVPLLKDKGYELTSAGEAKVNDKPAHGVHVTSKGHKDVSLFFDKKTGLLVKLEFRGNDPSGAEVNEERIILEYTKDKNGVPTPKKILVNHDGKKFLEAEVDGSLLEKLDDGVFKK